MNKNIKEIIKMSADEDIEIEYKDEKGSYVYKNIDIYELLDYITNLQEENERLNNTINKGIEAINVYQNEKTLSVGYQDLKRIRGILQGNEFDLQMFEEYLQELKGSDKSEK